jgi:hypothetical protein
LVLKQFCKSYETNKKSEKEKKEQKKLEEGRRATVRPGQRSGPQPTYHQRPNRYRFAAARR